MAAIAVTLVALAAMQVHRVVVQALLVAASAALAAIQAPLAVRVSALEATQAEPAAVQADQAAEAVNRTEVTPAVATWEVADKSRMIANYWGIEYLVQCPNQFVVRVQALSLRHSPFVESRS